MSDEVNEWGSAEQIFLRFGLKRGTLQKLADDGRIKSAMIKTEENSRKSIRVFNVQSIRDLLEAHSVS
jgi:hypothetical protein